MSGLTRRFLMVVHVALMTAFALWFVPQVMHRNHPSNENTKVTYQLQTLTLPDCKNSTATAVNVQGEATGYSWDEDPYLKAQPWVWKSGTFHRLPLPDGLEIAYPKAINNRGVVVGTGRRSDGYAVGIVWRNERATVVDRSADKVNVFFESINDRGQIVGTEIQNYPYYESEAILWEGDKATRLGSWNSTDINEEGVTTGTEYDGSFVNWSRALICEPGKGVRFFDIPDPYDFPHASALNAKRQVVGMVETIDDAYAVLWHDNAVTVLTDVPSVARDINDAGQVVGYLSQRPEIWTAFLWQAGKLTELQDTLPEDTLCTLTGANNINASGVIVGLGRQEGKHVGFVLTPKGK